MKSREISLYVSLGKQAAHGNVEVEDSGKLPILSDAASRALPQFAISSGFSDLLLRHPLMEVQVAFCPRMHSHQSKISPSPAANPHFHCHSLSQPMMKQHCQADIFRSQCLTYRWRSSWLCTDEGSTINSGDSGNRTCDTKALWAWLGSGGSSGEKLSYCHTVFAMSYRSIEWINFYRHAAGTDIHVALHVLWCLCRRPCSASSTS